jgi:hypothetical protein
MKKIITAAYVFACFLMLISCSSVNSNAPETAADSLAPTMDDSVASPSPSEISSPSTNDKEFDFSKDELIDAVDSFLLKHEFDEIISTESKQEDEYIDGVGTYSCSSYSLGDGTRLFIYYHPDTANVLSIMFRVVPDLATENSMLAYAYAVGIISAYIDGDSASEATDELNFENITEDATTFDHGNIGYYMYTVEDGKLMLFISK